MACLRNEACIGLLFGLLCLAGGCSRPTRTPATPVAMPDSFSDRGSSPPATDWWRDFDDASLDDLIAQALAENFNLRTAWDRLAQAEATARKANGSLWPQVNLNAGYRRSRQIVQGQTVHSDLYSVGVAASYEVDLWSRVRSSREAARLDAQAGRMPSMRQQSRWPPPSPMLGTSWPRPRPSSASLKDRSRSTGRSSMLSASSSVMARLPQPTSCDSANSSRLPRAS